MANYTAEHIIFILVISISLISCRRHIEAGTNKNMYDLIGETHPDTVEAAIGTNFNITCNMNLKKFPGENSTCLHFVISRTNKELPSKNHVTINSTTVVYMVRNASEIQAQYLCKCGTSAIMETKVYVGSRPRPIKDFSCRSFDFDHMICNFTKPPNPILTVYNVSYYNDLPNYIYVPQCNYDDRNLVVCNISLKDRYQEMYHFIIESRNALVEPNELPLIQHFDINNFDVMVPSKPGENIRIENVSVDSIKLLWQMPNWEKYRPKGLQWEVLLHPENLTIIQCEGPVREHNEIRLRLNNLAHAYWRYKLLVRVRVKSPNAIWSEQFIYTFRTKARLPQRPPLVQPGSFYIDSTETRITIYWEELLPVEYNGANFTYVITPVDSQGNLVDLKPLRQEKNLAKFSWRKDSYYEFEIRSRNHIGESIEVSRLIIYPTHRRNAKDFAPQSIHNVYHANNRTYTLTWLKPKNLTGLHSFTVYWCYPKRALPNECKESMHFHQIPAEQLNFTTKPQNAEHTLNLAVSANYNKFNTGLHWTDCTMDVTYDLVRLDPELIVLANSIKVQWSVGPVCPSILDGFNITFCEVANDAVSENATCLQNKLNHTLARKNDKKYSLNDLKPFTMYKVSMYMFSRTKKGKPSEPQVVRTLEGAPSPPRQLRVDGITNTSAIIKWYEPSHPNGKIRKYIIMLNNDQIEVNSSTLTYKLENLESFTAYKVYVLAETIKRSETSNDVHFTTAIGIPSPPGIATNNIASTIQWIKPVKPRGPIEYYEVLVKQVYKADVIRRRISIVTGATACTFVKVPSCIGADYKTSVEVRAVNVVPLTDKPSFYAYSSENLDDYSGNEDLECITSSSHTAEYLEKVKKYLNTSLYEFYKSPWQTSTMYSCSTSRLSKITTIALVVVTMSLGVMAALYMARKKYKKMANINCTLPAGLETYLTKETSTGFHGDFGSGNETFNDRAAEDQWISAIRMQEFNFRNEQHHHLLASLGNDSGYLGGGLESGVNVRKTDALEASDISEEILPKDDYIQAYSKNMAKVCSNASSLSEDTLVESTERSDCQNISPNSIGYIKQSMLQPWQTFNDQYDDNADLPIVAMTPGGYITPQSLNSNLFKPNSTFDFSLNKSGYVLQQDLQNLFNKTAVMPPPEQTHKQANTPQINSSGYTTLDNISKLNINSSQAPHALEASQINSSGYTTLDNISKLNINSSQAPHAERNRQHSQSANPNASQTCVGVSGVDSGGDVKSSSISGYVTQHDLNLFAQHQQNY